MHEVEVWVFVDADGDYRVGTTQDEAREAYSNDVGATTAAREFKITLNVPLPVPVELTGTVPAESTEGASLSVA